MNTFWLSLYILIWPAISAILLAMLVVAVTKDYRTARRNGEDVV